MTMNAGFKSEAMVQGFSVVQEASLMVQSFPRAPDVFALLKELAVSTGQYTVLSGQEEVAPEPEQAAAGSAASGSSPVRRAIQKTAYPLCSYSIHLHEGSANEEMI